MLDVRHESGVPSLHYGLQRSASEHWDGVIAEVDILSSMRQFRKSLKDVSITYVVSKSDISNFLKI